MMETVHPSQAQTVTFGKSMVRCENPGVLGIVAWRFVPVIEFGGRRFHMMEPHEESVAMDVDSGEFVRLEMD